MEHESTLSSFHSLDSFISTLLSNRDELITAIEKDLLNLSKGIKLLGELGRYVTADEDIGGMYKRKERESTEEIVSILIRSLQKFLPKSR